MTVRLSFPDAKAFQNILEAISKLIDELAIIVTPEGARAKALDAAHVALIEIVFPPEFFLEYTVKEESKVGFNTSTLLKLLKRSRKGDRLDIEVEGDSVTYAIIGTTTKKYKLLNLDIPEPEIPEAKLEFKVSASMIVDPLKNAIKDAETVGDTLELEAPDENILILRGKGVAQTEARISKESGALIEYVVEEPSKSSYSVEYLKHVVALTKIADTVKLDFARQMPLRLEFGLPGDARVTYLLAPKME